MTSAQCPKCDQLVIGTLAQIQSHIIGCSVRKSVKKAKASKNQKVATAPTVPLVLKPKPKGYLRQISFFIPGMVTTSLNPMLHQHVGAAFRDKERWREAVLTTLGKAPTVPDCVVAVTIVRMVSHASKRLDPDNLAGSFKYLIDAIKTAGWLRDDGPDDIRLSPSQTVCDDVGMYIELTYLKYR